MESFEARIKYKILVNVISAAGVVLCIDADMMTSWFASPQRLTFAQSRHDSSYSLTCTRPASSVSITTRWIAFKRAIRTSYVVLLTWRLPCFVLFTISVFKSQALVANVDVRLPRTTRNNTKEFCLVAIFHSISERPSPSRVHRIAPSNKQRTVRNVVPERISTASKLQRNETKNVLLFSRAAQLRTID